MRSSDVGDHGHIRLRRAAEAIDLPQTAHAHLHHHGRTLRTGLEQRERDTDVVVFIAAAGHHRTERSQGGTDQLTGGGLAGRAGHGHHRRLQAAAVQQAQVLVGSEGVIDEPVQQSGWYGCGPLALHQRRLSPQCRRLIEKPVAIEALPHQRHEQLPSRQVTAVGADRAHSCLGIELKDRAPGGTPAVDQGAQLHRLRRAGN